MVVVYCAVRVRYVYGEKSISTEHNGLMRFGPTGSHCIVPIVFFSACSLPACIIHASYRVPRTTLVLGVRITRTINLRGPVVLGRETIYLNAILCVSGAFLESDDPSRNRREHWATRWRDTRN